MFFVFIFVSIFGAWADAGARPPYCISANLYQFLSPDEHMGIRPRFSWNQPEKAMPLVETTVECLNSSVRQMQKLKRPFQIDFTDDRVGPGSDVIAMRLNQEALSKFLSALLALKTKYPDSIPDVTCYETGKADWIHCSNRYWHCSEQQIRCDEVSK